MVPPTSSSDLRSFLEFALDTLAPTPPARRQTPTPLARLALVASLAGHPDLAARALLRLAARLLARPSMPRDTVTLLARLDHPLLPAVLRDLLWYASVAGSQKRPTLADQVHTLLVTCRAATTDDVLLAELVQRMFGPARQARLLLDRAAAVPDAARATRLLDVMERGPLARWYQRKELALLALEHGDVERARRLLRPVLPVAAPANEERWRSMTRWLKFLYHYRLLDEARKLRDLWEAWVPTGPPERHGMFAHRVRAIIQDAAEARAEFEEILAGRRSGLEEDLSLPPKIARWRPTRRRLEHLVAALARDVGRATGRGAGEIFPAEATAALSPSSPATPGATEEAAVHRPVLLGIPAEDVAALRLGRAPASRWDVAPLVHLVVTAGNDEDLARSVVNHLRAIVIEDPGTLFELARALVGDPPDEDEGELREEETDPGPRRILEFLADEGDALLRAAGVLERDEEETHRRDAPSLDRWFLLLLARANDALGRREHARRLRMEGLLRLFPHLSRERVESRLREDPALVDVEWNEGWICGRDAVSTDPAGLLDDAEEAWENGFPSLAEAFFHCAANPIEWAVEPDCGLGGGPDIFHLERSRDLLRRAAAVAEKIGLWSASSDYEDRAEELDEMILQYTDEDEEG